MKKIILIIIIAIAASCSSTNRITSNDHKIKKVKVGMTKRRVTSIMGDNYQILASGEGRSTWGYQSSHQGIYRLHFKDGKLKKWNKKWLRNNHNPHPKAYNRRNRRHHHKAH